MADKLVAVELDKLARAAIEELKGTALDTDDLATRPEMQPKMEELAARIHRWQAQTDDRVNLSRP